MKVNIGKEEGTKMQMKNITAGHIILYIVYDLILIQNAPLH